MSGPAPSNVPLPLRVLPQLSGRHVAVRDAAARREAESEGCPPSPSESPREPEVEERGRHGRPGRQLVADLPRRLVREGQRGAGRERRLAHGRVACPAPGCSRRRTGGSSSSPPRRPSPWPAARSSISVNLSTPSVMPPVVFPASFIVPATKRASRRRSGRPPRSSWRRRPRSSRSPTPPIPVLGLVVDRDGRVGRGRARGGAGALELVLDGTRRQHALVGDLEAQPPHRHAGDDDRRALVVRPGRGRLRAVVVAPAVAGLGQVRARLVRADVPRRQRVVPSMSSPNARLASAERSAPRFLAPMSPPVRWKSLPGQR